VALSVAGGIPKAFQANSNEKFCVAVIETY
jgi:hypothetical protein